MILWDKSINVVVDRITISEGCVLPQELFNARNQFQFFLCRQILIFIEQQLELVLQTPYQLIKSNLVLIIGQLCQLLHSSHGFVTSEHYRVQDLRHDEEVVNLLTKHVFDAKVVQNFKLAAFNCDFWCSLSGTSCFVNEELLIELLFNLFEFI